MLIVTGGAGFIGSCLQAALAARGRRTIVIDRLRDGKKWRNLHSHPPDQIIDPEYAMAFLKSLPRGAVHGVFHLGAISATTVRDGDLAWHTNVSFSQDLWRFCAHRNIPFFYASSAATYGAADKAEEFKDGIGAIKELKPLNLYGWTKQSFDLWVARELENKRPAPPQWVGLKFFNVYGPNEYHKGSMQSVACQIARTLRQGEKPRLFKSTGEGIADGGQLRDFVWVGDIVQLFLWFFYHPATSGLFNAGTGKARSFLDMAKCLCREFGVPEEIEFIDPPEQLKKQYQNFTEADLTLLRQSGYQFEFTSLEKGIKEYVRKYLRTEEKNL
ncbi:ADP-glyceromanno-heptose 6-epimerase [Acetobacteraceae bacterium]|nr:ADP-glyceromanno-heptose 6-epimerase [Acetobacteraceae bacterium]QCE35767.1 ADP-glyceromanno-heptose 6-epimerase [Acetobacteraceae bacterium]